MPYTDFTLESAETRFGLSTALGNLFPDLKPLAVPAWLSDQLGRGHAVAALVSEKARSEFLVAPVLLACRELVEGDLAIYSGQRLDVDAGQGLSGECDYYPGPEVPQFPSPTRKRGIRWPRRKPSLARRAWKTPSEDITGRGNTSWP